MTKLIRLTVVILLTIAVIAAFIGVVFLMASFPKVVMGIVIGILLIGVIITIGMTIHDKLY